MSTKDGILGTNCGAKWETCEEGHDDTFKGYRCFWKCMTKPAGRFFGREQCGAKWTVCDQRCDEVMNMDEQLDETNLHKIKILWNAGGH